MTPTHRPSNSITDSEDLEARCGDQQRPARQKRTPLPVLPLSILYLIQFGEPVAATVIYPFINQFVRETGIIKGDERKTGYFGGLIVGHLVTLMLLNRRTLTNCLGIHILLC
jgi:hypothetical protein